jgi:hypothetical protein
VRKIFWTISGLWICGLLVVARADSLQLIDGSSVSGNVVTFNDNGLMLRMADDSYTNLLWTKFSQDALVQLGKNPKIKPLVEPFIETPPSKRVKKPEITVREDISRLQLPPKQSLFPALFSSSVGFIILLLIYAANMYAAYEIAAMRAHPVGLVLGVAAVLPILGPIIFLSMPIGNKPADHVASHPAAKTDIFAIPGAAGEVHVAGAARQKASTHYEPQIFQRGQFTFNRRFFETKFSNFFPTIRRESEKDLEFIVKTARGQTIIQRITRIASNDVHFEVLQGVARREIMMSFADIQEIEIRHKDA